MLATISSASLAGVRGSQITVEVHVSAGLPSFTIVGLPDASCRESRDRVRAAVHSSGLAWPQTRVTVNLAPSGIRKAGAGLDLAIALGVVVANGDLPTAAVDGWSFIGELGLDGSLRPVTGALPLAAACGGRVVVPRANYREAALVPSIEVAAETRLVDVIESLAGSRQWSQPPGSPPAEPRVPLCDLASVAGQPLAKRAVEVAAAGGHHLLFIGPPGAGKTMLAKALPDLLPTLDHEDALETTTVHSAAGIGLPSAGLVSRPPFRAPHHTSSMVSLVGGGSQTLRPGEISCAHAGVLFLDELGEFPASVLDALRQPLEEGVVRVARAYGSATLPARVLLVGAMNPCPCGEAASIGMARDGCRCSDVARQRYSRRVSGPLLDRFDLRVHVERLAASTLFSSASEESSADVASRVGEARVLASERGVRSNSAIPPGALDDLAPLETGARRLLERSMEAGRLSARGVHRIRRVALTVADLDRHGGPLQPRQVAAALALRAEVLTLCSTGSVI